MSLIAKSFQFIKDQWDKTKAHALEGDEIALLLYRSNVLGSDLKITNYGGGNTSCKTTEIDPLTGEETQVMWVKGSGGDIGTLTRSGLAGLYVDRLHNLKKRYRGLEHEDEMVELFYHCLYDLNSKAPSIDTPLHAFLPYKHIDHLHPDAIIAIAASKDGEEITKNIFEGKLAWIPWQRPGFDLALQLEECVNQNPGIEGIILGGHGLFTWGETAHECYINSLDKINRAAKYLESEYGKKAPIFGGPVRESLPEGQRREQAARIAPILRGMCSSYAKMIGHFTDDERVLEFINSADLEKLAPLGTSCPDHFLRTKIRPLVLPFEADMDVKDESVVDILEKEFNNYRAYYKQYYEEHKRPNSPAVRDPNPVIILWPGVGLFSFAKNKQTARVASEFYINAINVMKGAEAISEYVSLPLQEAFDIEYWLLEEAKLQRMPTEKPLSRRNVIVTGGSGGIGKAIADKFSQEGACVFITDIDKQSLEAVIAGYGKDNASCAVMDVTDPESIDQAFLAANLYFGGADIIVNCAGLAISKPMLDTTDRDWSILQDVIVKGQFNVTRQGMEYIRAMKLGGDVINIASKNGLVSGPNNVGYGTAKAAQIHMSRLMAAEFGPDKVRVNVVNPDAVINGSKIWEGEWAEGRAKAHGIKPEDLPKHYAKRTLMNEIIEIEDIANAAFAFAGGLLSKSTGNILNVDGGIAPAFPR
ncbi:MAG: bifunctional rhamnulose-1-phosphate aldolase/short-chain dehydrogenase [Bacteroidota bacterium]